MSQSLYNDDRIESDEEIEDNNIFIPSDENLSGKSEAIGAKKSYRNYIRFCVLYSITHATCDGVLAFSTAELGPVVGSYGKLIV